MREPTESEKVAAINLMLRDVDPAIKRLAELYIEQVRHTATFTQFLRDHPIGDAEAKP